MWPGKGRGQGYSQKLEFWENRPGRNPGTYQVKRDPLSNNFKLHVRSIPPTWDKKIFESVFRRCGNPLNIFIQPPKHPNALTWGFVEFQHYLEASEAVRQLNNNVLLNIQVAFAREKPQEEDIDPILKFLASQPEEMDDYEMNYEPIESLADPKTLTKTIKRDDCYSSSMVFDDFYKQVFDAEDQKSIDEAIFHKILEIYNEDCAAKCNVCEKNCSLACSGCTMAFYCSENCQNQDWTSHSRNCKGLTASSETVEDNNWTQTRAGGDQRQTNGYGSFDNQADRRITNDRGSYKENNRDFNRGFNKEEQNSNEQGKKSLFEERKAKMAMSSRQNESGRGFTNQSRFGQNNQKPQHFQQSRNSIKPRPNAEEVDEEWGCKNEGKDTKVSSATTPGLDFINKEKAFLQENEIKKDTRVTPAGIKQEIKNENLEATAPKPAIKADKVNTATQELKLQPGIELEVMIYHTEAPGLFWVQKSDQRSQIAPFFKTLEDYFTKYSSQFSPVKDGICGIKYEGQWYRCQVDNLNPLSVIYIDFGYPEEVEANRLFELSPELMSLPALAFRIKMIDGTPEITLGKVEADTINVKLIEKIDSSLKVDFWLAQDIDHSLTPAKVSEAATNIDSPALVTCPSETKAEPAQPDKDLKTTQKSPVPEAATTENDQSEDTSQKPYPPMLNGTKFNTVVITYQGGDKNTYYVGASTIWNALVEMCANFMGVIQKCDVLSLKLGTKGLAQFQGSWYRVEIVSMTPNPLAYYIDFGNTETIQPGELRECPDTHKDIPPLVQKIKLAPGTDQKYFNLPDESEISVKPVSWLSEGSILVEVEGENYAKEASKRPEDSISLVNNAASSGPPVTPAFTGPATVQVDGVPSGPDVTVDLLQEKWKITLVPNKADLVKYSLIGQIWEAPIHSILSFITENDKFQNYLSSQEFDPNFKPVVGEIVGLKHPSGSWERGKVLPREGLVSFIDYSGTTSSCQLFKIPETYVNIPSMAAEITFCKDDLDLLKRLVKEDELNLEVTKVIKKRGKTVVSVCCNDSLEGELRAWDYEPLETADPLAQGDSVTITTALYSNTLLISPANDLQVQQTIQIECRKASGNFKCPPEVGDYAIYLDKETDGYLRCRIKRIEDTYAVHTIDYYYDTYQNVKFGDLHPLPESLRNVPCRISQIELKDVDEVDLTEQAQMYLNHIIEEEIVFTYMTDERGKATLFVKGEEDTVNSKLQKFLKPQIVPNTEGKLTISSAVETRVPLNQEYRFIITQTEPLYVQLASSASRYYGECHNLLQEHCSKDSAPYNPCEGELCIALYEGEWYRCRCLRETNTGVSALMLVDFGNIFNAKTSNIRRILPEMLTVPLAATSCKVHGLPETISPALRERLNEILQVDTTLSGVFVAEQNCQYEVVVESVKAAIQELQ